MALKEFPQSIFFLFRRRLSSSKCSFIVYWKSSLPTLFCECEHVTAPNRHAHVRIVPIVRRIRNPPIRNGHICPCDSSGYQNELLYTNSPTDYENGLDECVGRLRRRLRFKRFKIFRASILLSPGMCGGKIPRQSNLTHCSKRLSGCKIVYVYIVI